MILRIANNRFGVNSKVSFRCLGSRGCGEIGDWDSGRHFTRRCLFCYNFDIIIFIMEEVKIKESGETVALRAVAQNIINAGRTKAERMRREAQEQKIQVEEAASSVAFWYEKIRNTIDYKDERLWRKNAIRRVLKRLFLSGKSGPEVAEILLKELIRSRYLGNNEIPLSYVENAAFIVEKYRRFAEKIWGQIYPDDKFNDFIGVAAADIDLLVSPAEDEHAVVSAMYEIMRDRAKFTGGENLDESTKNIQIYLAAHEVILRSDADYLRYHILTIFVPRWTDNVLEDGELDEMADNWGRMREVQDFYLNGSLRGKVVLTAKKLRAPFNILAEVVKSYGAAVGAVFSSHAILEEKIEEVYLAKHEKTRRNLSRKALRVIIYLFLTKIALGILLEVPYELFILGELKELPLVVNTLFPPFLVLAFALFIKLPSAKNLAAVKKGAKEIIYLDEEEEIFKDISVNIGGRRGGLGQIVFYVFYFILFIVSFGFTLWVLTLLDFNLVSTVVFFFFLSLVSFFGVILRQEARELVLVAGREGFLSFLFDLFTLPILKAGQWLTKTFSRINAVVFIFDFLIEAPFKRIVEIFEEWVRYMREEKQKLG